MKILLTTPTYPPFNSGLGNAVRQLALALRHHSCEVVVATGGTQRQQRQDADSGVTIETFAVDGAENVLNPIRGNDVDVYRRFLLESKFDLIILNAWQTWSTDICLAMLDRIKGRKILFSHCVSTNTWYAPQPLRSLLRYLSWRPYWFKMRHRMHQLDGLVFLARTGCDARFDDMRLAEQESLTFEVIPNALSAAATQILDAPTWQRYERSQLIAVGAYEWQKGHDFVLRAYAASSAANRIPLKIFGQVFSVYTESLRAMCGELGLSDKMVTFYEGYDEVALAAEYQKSIAFMSGSHTECQPLVLLDAMAAGTPFVARATGCIPELAGGISVKSERAATQALNTLLASDETWRKYCEAGQTIAREHHHPARVSEKIVDTLLQQKAGV